MPTGTPSGAQTLERGLAVLRELGRHTDGLSTAQVAEVTGLHRTVVHRLLVSLVGTGFARRDARGRHHVGPAVTALAASAPLALRDLAAPLLQDLADRIGLAVSLVEVEEGAAVTTLVAHPAAEGPQFAYRLGHREPLDRGAGGIAAVASAPAVDDEPVAVTLARYAGVAVTHGELNPGAHGLAVPLPGWAAPAAATVVSYDPAVVERVRTPLLETAAEIGRLAP
ncbi:helix-turn-helix domain-containing protein [Nocardioides anomalus]|uniref:Helix-turn-helix domain-containing protein n=1 Tax=Nocardioides anomalus TaxID=2712223 RepID=A0A6G6W833_9ACTN|nr:helix-turn-helix domain-containing protein [Nocardioides anomalus]QIG41369.1 helix-turn-helix domain-containing protein [Nocardioides anomalus]